MRAPGPDLRPPDITHGFSFAVTVCGNQSSPRGISFMTKLETITNAHRGSGIPFITGGYPTMDRDDLVTVIEMESGRK